MATAQLARPAQALRNKRDAQRPSASKRPVAATDSSADGPSKKRKLNEPYVRDSQYILRKHNGKDPSFIIHLYATHFRFEEQEGSFAYDSPMNFLIKHLKSQTVPHEMLENMLNAGVRFYDGCLIAEIHNHRNQDGQKSGGRQGKAGDAMKFSMQNYNEHVTPSPFASFPDKAQTEPKSQNNAQGSPKDADKTKGTGNGGPKITTVVLHPTELSRNEEVLILARTAASELRGKRKVSDGGNQANGQPPTPQLQVPPTPAGSSSRTPQLEKKALEQQDLYSFEGDVLLTTEPPLYLEPAKDAAESQAILNMLQHPLHSGKPPAPKERKRTTAEMEADDKQAEEAERRMLIMDERIKPSARGGAAAATGEGSAAATSLGFSRFKTIEMVRQKQEEQECAKKEEEARAVVEKRQFDEQAQQQAQQQQQAKMVAQRKQAELAAQQAASLKQRQMLVAQQQAESLRQAQQQANLAAQHGHPAQAGMMQNSQQGNYQQSPPRQQTPMMNSSPMLPQGGFAMTATGSQQGAGSPPRPASAAMNHPNVPMARIPSQQANGSHNNTPQIPQGTPSMHNAVPNRNMSQTPRLQPGSPANLMQGTPTPMMIPTPQMANSNLTPEQMHLLRAQAQMPNAASMNPELIQLVNRIKELQNLLQSTMMQAQVAQSQNNPTVYNQASQRIQSIKSQLEPLKQRYNLYRQQQNVGNMAVGSPAGMQRTPQMNHGHPGMQQGQQMHTPQPQQQGVAMPGQNLNPQQQQAYQQARLHQQQQQAQVQRHLANLAQQHGGQIPQSILAAQQPVVQQMYRQQQINAQNRARAQQQQARLQQQQQQSMLHQGLQTPGGQGQGQDPAQYMQNMNNLRAGLAMQMNQQQQQLQQQQQGGMNTNGMGMGMGMGDMQQYGPQGDEVSQRMAQMQEMLNRQRGMQ